MGAPEDYHRGHSDAIIMNLVLNDLCCYIPPCKKGNSDAVFNRSGCFPAKLLNSHATLIRRTKQLRVNVSESQRDQIFRGHGQKNRFDLFLIQVKMQLACENIRFSSLFAAGNVSRGGMSATQRQKFHTDDANQSLHNKLGSHGLPIINLSSFTCLLVDFGKVHGAWPSSE